MSEYKLSDDHAQIFNDEESSTWELRAVIAELAKENQRYRMALEKIVTMPKSHEAVRLAVMVLENKDD